MTYELVGALATFVALTGFGWFILKTLMGDGPEFSDFFMPALLSVLLPVFFIALCLYPIWGPAHWAYQRFRGT